MQLPVESAVILPVAPYIPEGFAGSFPVTIQMLDPIERPNQRRIDFSLTWMGKRVDGTTGPDGRAGVVIPLSGAERAGFPLELHAEGRQVAVMPIALKAAAEQFVIGRVVSSTTGSGINRMTVSADNRQTALSNPDGYFFLSMPMRAFNITMNITPTTGYLPATIRHKTDGKNVQTPLITLTPRVPGLLGRRIGIIAQRDQDAWARPLVKALMQGGARVRRLPNGSGPHPEHEAIATANQEGGYDLLIAIKPGSGTSVELRHYHRSQVGKTLAQAIVKKMDRKGGVKAGAGSDYELGHTGAPALVVQTPAQTVETLPASFAAALIDALPAAIEPK